MIFWGEVGWQWSVSIADCCYIRPVVWIPRVFIPNSFELFSIQWGLQCFGRWCTATCDIYLSPIPKYSFIWTDWNSQSQWLLDSWLSFCDHREIKESNKVSNTNSWTFQVCFSPFRFPTFIYSFPFSHPSQMKIAKSTKCLIN